MARSVFHKKVREHRALASQPLNSQKSTADKKSNPKTAINSQNTSSSDSPVAYKNPPSVAEDVKQSPSGTKDLRR